MAIAECPKVNIHPRKTGSINGKSRGMVLNSMLPKSNSIATGICATPRLNLFLRSKIERVTTPMKDVIRKNFLSRWGDIIRSRIETTAWIGISWGFIVSNDNLTKTNVIFC